MTQTIIRAIITGIREFRIYRAHEVMSEYDDKSHEEIPDAETDGGLTILPAEFVNTALAVSAKEKSGNRIAKINIFFIL
jgi:hypothetical protein